MDHGTFICGNDPGCGDNCAKWILKIADILADNGEDLVIRLGYLMDFGKEPFEIIIENLGMKVTKGTGRGGSGPPSGVEL